MSDNRVRETLTQVASAVEVPTRDEVAFRSRVRAERRRRTVRRSLVAAAAVVTVVGLATVVVRPGGDETRTATDVPPVGTADVRAAALDLAGRLLVLESDGTSHTSDIRVQRVLGSTDRGIVVLGRDSHLRLVSLGVDGEPGRARDIAGGGPVTSAALSSDGLSVAFVDDRGVVHLRETGLDSDLAISSLSSPDAELLAVDGTRWLERDGDSLLLREGNATRKVTTAFPALGAALADETMTVQTLDGVEVFEASTAQNRHGSLGWNTGTLAPDGRHYVSTPDDEQVTQEGARPGIEVIDTVVGEVAELTGFDGLGVAQALAWQDDDRFLVLGTDPTRPGDRVLWDCSLSADSCTERYDDPSGTLALARP